MESNWPLRNRLIGYQTLEPNLNFISFSRAIHPIKYYRDYINHNIRPDGRKFDKFRPIRINVNSIGTADGSAIVKLGNTTVVCGIKAVSNVTKLNSKPNQCDRLIVNEW